jgi:hypothetical protein
MWSLKGQIGEVVINLLKASSRKLLGGQTHSGIGHTMRPAGIAKHGITTFHFISIITRSTLEIA